MIKIFKKTQEVILNGKKCGNPIRARYEVSENSELKKDSTTTITNFEKLLEDVRKGEIICAQEKFTLFRNRPYILMIFNTMLEYTITEKNFKSVIVKTFREDVTDKLTIKEVSNILSATDFCKFLKERGITKM